MAYVVGEVARRQIFIEALQFQSDIILPPELRIICIAVTDTI